MKDKKVEIIHKIDSLTREIGAAKHCIQEAETEVAALKKELEKLDKKPMMYYKHGASIPNEIIKYKKYSHNFVEFETEGCKYRYLTTGTDHAYILPEPGSKAMCIFNSGHIFEAYDIVTRGYYAINWIDHIELLEGVDEYDKTREL